MKDRAIIFNDIVSHIWCLPNEPISRPSTCDCEDYKDTSAFFSFEEKRSTGRIPLSSKGRVVKLVDENRRNDRVEEKREREGSTARGRDSTLSDVLYLACVRVRRIVKTRLVASVNVSALPTAKGNNHTVNTEYGVLLAKARSNRTFSIDIDLVRFSLAIHENFQPIHVRVSV